MATGDAENCIRVIVAALSQAAERFNGTTPQDAATPDGTPQVTLAESAEFADMVTSIVAAEESDVERLRHIVFEVSPALVGTIVAFLETPKVSAPANELAALQVAVLRCVSRIACACCSDQVRDRSPGVEYLSSLCSGALQKHSVVHRLAALLSPVTPVEVQFSAAETLFALLMRSDQAKVEVASTRSLQALMLPLSESTSASLRAYVAACIRELANAHSGKIVSEAVIDLLTRLLALDEAADVRALAAETIDVFFKTEPVAWERCTRRKELATAVVNRLDNETSFEVIEATLKLVETLIVADVSQPPSPEMSFTDYFLGSYGDRSLVKAMNAGPRVASLCARCLRLVIQLSPFHRQVGFNLVQHVPTMAQVLERCVDLANDTANKEVLNQIYKVELSMAFAMLLAQDPRSRQLLSSQLHEDQDWMAKIRAAVLANLNAAALEYYGGINIVDVTGTLVNDITAMEWEMASRPTKESVSAAFARQEQLWQAAKDVDLKSAAAGKPDARHARPEGQDAASRSMRLTFIMLSFATHVTLAPSATEEPRQAAQPKPQPSSMVERMSRVYPAAGAVPEDFTAVEDRRPANTSVGVRLAETPNNTRAGQTVLTEYGIVGPEGTDKRPGAYPTRTSMLREWRAHPEKFAAVRRTADFPEELGRKPGSYFVDPSVASVSRTNRSEASGIAPSAPNRTQIFSKFDAALQLASQFAQCYNSVGDPHRVIFETSGDGFARRQSQKTAHFNTTHAMRTKSWTLHALKEGDLFYFSVPFVALSSFAIEQIRQRAMRHLDKIKKSFVITPQAAKARRWFLYDMTNHIMPGIVNTMSMLLDCFERHGDENVKYPIVMFREKDLAVEGEQASFHAGNMVEVVDQVRFYFEKNAHRGVTSPGGNSTMFGGTPKHQMAPGMSSAGVPAAAGAPNVNTQYLQDLERKIKALSEMQFTGDEANSVPAEFAEDGMAAEDVDSDSDISIAEPIGGHRLRSRVNRADPGAGTFFDDASDVSSIE